MFIDAFLNAEKSINEEYINNSCNYLQFSEHFEKKMNKLLKKEKRMSFSTRTIIKHAFVYALIAAFIIVTTLFSVEATRNQLIKFVKHFKATYLDIEISDESVKYTKPIDKYYMLSYVTKDYKLVSSKKEDYFYMEVWQNDKNEQIVFSQGIINAGITIDTEHTFKQINFNGYDAYIVAQDKNILFSWNDDEYIYSIHADNSDEEEIIKIAKNIKKCK